MPKIKNQYYLDKIELDVMNIQEQNKFIREKKDEFELKVKHS